MHPSAVQATTTSSLEGWLIQHYKGPVAAHVVAGTNIFSDFFAGFSDIFGGRSGAYQEQLQRLYGYAVRALGQEAAGRGANWIVGLRVDFDEISGQGKQMFMVTATGTAVVAHPTVPDVPAHSGEGVPWEEVRVERDLARLRAKNPQLLELDEATAALLTIRPAPDLLLPVFRTQAQLNTTWRADTLAKSVPRLVPVLQRVALADLQDACYAALREPKVRELPLAILAWRQAISPARTFLLLGDPDVELRRTALRLCVIPAGALTAADAAALRALAAGLDSAFPDRWPESTVKNVFRDNWQVWQCPCGNQVSDRNDVCRSCQRNRFGLTHEDPAPASVAEDLAEVAAALDRLLPAAARAT